LPIIGVIDPQRARQLTEQLLRAIRANRAKVVVIDVTGVAAMDSGVANHLVQTVEASRLLGATVIVTGLSPEIAQTLVTIGVDLSEMATVGDLQGGIEEAERLLADRAPPTTQVRDIAHMARLRGAETVIVGIQPDVAFAMVQLGLTLKGVATVLDLEEGLAFLNRRTEERTFDSKPKKPSARG